MSLVASGLFACSAAGQSTTGTGPTPKQSTVGTPAGSHTAAAARDGWHVVVRPVNIEAGPSGLLVSATVPGPLVVLERSCTAPLSVWLVDRATGRRVDGSLHAVRPSGTQCPAGRRLVPIRKGMVRTFIAVIPFPIPAGSYRVRGLLTTAMRPAGVPLPSVEISWP